MKRRTFGKLAGGSLLAMQAAGIARANGVSPDASQLGTTLTPMGGEMAGSADGSIPAWTGGLSTLPSGVSPGDFVPELFPNEQPVVVIDSSNMADHAALLTDGVKAMMTKYGFKIKVYPTHRTAAAPQWVYDNIKANVGTAKFTADDPVGGRFGFEGAFGGVPFPIPDQSNPATAGAQIIWNLNSAWLGKAFKKPNPAGWSVSNGQKVMASSAGFVLRYPYYIAKSVDEFNNKYHGALYEELVTYTGPANLIGQAIIVDAFANPYKQPQEAWELLNGQGRVRRAPEISFDTPSGQSNGIANYDEYYGFNGSLERYDWKLLGKQEMYIPYNNNAVYAAAPQHALLEKFVDPDLVRWEKHRCWVVEATLHPGERNVLARRKLYIDEDTWLVGVVDAWDGNNNLYTTNHAYNNCQPELPGVVFGNNVVYNLQTGNYAAILGVWNGLPTSYVDDWPESTFDANNMAASAQY